MTLYTNLSIGYQSLFIISNIILCLWLLNLAINPQRQYVRIFAGVLFIPTVLFLMVLVKVLIHDFTDITALFARRPYFQMGSVLLCDYLVIRALTVSYKIVKPKMTSNVIKESCDDLYSGLAYYANDGTMLLINTCMEELGRMVSGYWLTDGNRLWNNLAQPLDDVILLKEGPQPVLSFPNGRIWSFARRQLTINNNIVYEVLATDITDLYKYSQQLQEDNRQLDEINKRLLKHNSEIEQVTRQEEQLATRIQIHDEMGRSLLATRAYLTEHIGTVDGLNAMWHRTIELLKRQTKIRSEDDGLKQLQDAAVAIDMKIGLTGQLPQADNQAMRLIINAGKECMTNAVRHAQAKNMYINISTTAYEYVVSFTNDGLAPGGKIKLGGGLSSLQKSVEQAGGWMRVVSQPKLCITIGINRKGDEA